MYILLCSRPWIRKRCHWMIESKNIQNIIRTKGNWSTFTWVLRLVLFKRRYPSECMAEHSIFIWQIAYIMQEGIGQFRMPTSLKFSTVYEIICEWILYNIKEILSKKLHITLRKFWAKNYLNVGETVQKTTHSLEYQDKPTHHLIMLFSW